MGARLVRRCCSTFLLLLVPALALIVASPWARSSLLVAALWLLPFYTGRYHLTADGLDWLGRLPAPSFQPEEDLAGQLCRAASVFREHFKAFNIRTERSVRLFQASCLRVLPRLDLEVRRDLERRVLVGGEVLKSALQDIPMQPTGVPPQDWATCGAGFERMDEEDMDDVVREIYHKSGRRPLKLRRVNASEVHEAFGRAEVVTFDARGLVPARMFNASIPQLNELHPAVDVVVHTTSDSKHGYESMACHYVLHLMTIKATDGGTGSLLQWLAAHGLTERLLARFCHPHWTLRELAAMIKNFQPSGFSHALGDAEQLAAVQAYDKVCARGAGLMGSNINVQRLPNWTRGEFDPLSMLEQLGLAGQAEHAHNLLWLGSSPGGMHNDIQDNVLVQIAGESDVLAVPANCSFGLDTGLGFGIVTADWLRRQPPDFPFHVIRLRPGDGVAIPSNTMHVVASKDPWRIGMNFFIEPRHGRMKWPWAPANFFNYAGKGHLAMRDLWVKTVVDMWETREPGSPAFVVHGVRQELV